MIVADIQGNLAHLTIFIFTTLFLIQKIFNLDGILLFKYFINYFIKVIRNSIRSFAPFLNKFFVSNKSTNFRISHNSYKIDLVNFSYSENRKYYFFYKGNIFKTKRYYSTNSWKNHKFNYANYQNPDLTVNDFYFLSSSLVTVNNYYQLDPFYHRINSITKEIIPVNEFGIDIPNIIFINADLYKYLKLWAFRINISDFPNGTSEYLNLDPKTEVHDLKLGMRFGLLYYYAIIKEVQKNEVLFNELSNIIHFDEYLFSPELIDFCIQKWSDFSNLKKKKKNQFLKKNYNKLGLAIGFHLKHSKHKEEHDVDSYESFLKYHKIFSDIQMECFDYSSLLSEIDSFLKKKK